jgi:hypothetical protein
MPMNSKATLPFWAMVLAAIAGVFLGVRFLRDSWAQPSGVAAGSWIRVEGESIAGDGVTHRCHAFVGPAVSDAVGSSVRPASPFSVYLHPSTGEYLGVAASSGFVSCGVSDPFVHGSGPFEGEGWTGAGRKTASLAPAEGRTWANVRGADDVGLRLSVVED